MKNLDWINNAVRASIPAIVVVSLLLFRKWFPSTPSRQQTDWNSDELYARFKPLCWRVWGGMVLVMIGFALGTWFALSRTNQLIARFDEPSAIHLLPEPAIWWFFPGFGALVCSYEITLQILKHFVGRETTEMFNDWANNTTRGWVRSRYTGIDSRRVLRWMMLGIALPIGLFVVLALPMRANVGPDSIRDCGYAFKPCKVYLLPQVIRITEIAGFRDNSGKIVHRAGLVLDFTDGSRWSSAEWGDWKKQVDPALEEYLVKKTGREPEFALTEKDIPPIAIDPTQP